MDTGSEDFSAEWVTLTMAFLIIMGALATNGRSVYEYTDAELYAIISDMGEAQTRLSCIKNKPTSLVKLLSSTSNDIIRLLEWMKNR